MRNQQTIDGITLAQVSVGDDSPSTRYQPLTTIVVKFLGVGGNEYPIDPLLDHSLLRAVQHLSFKALDVAMEQVDFLQAVLPHQPIHSDFRRLERAPAMARTDKSIDEYSAQTV